MPHVQLFTSSTTTTTTYIAHTSHMHACHVDVMYVSNALQLVLVVVTVVLGLMRLAEYTS